MDPVHQIEDTLFQDSSNFGIPWNSAIEAGTLVDSRDGWKYKTVRVAGLVWMAQNLEYRAPTPDAGELLPDSVGHCPDLSRDSCSKYGRLYTWAEAMAVQAVYMSDTAGSRIGVRGVCPPGSHLPSGSEWTSLQSASGGVSGASSLKASAGWGEPGTDRLGMRFLPAGYEDGGDFLDRGVNTLFWVRDEFDATYSWNWFLYQGYGGLLRGLSSKSLRLSVRCVLD